jgi:hypothetical protein
VARAIRRQFSSDVLPSIRLRAGLPSTGAWRTVSPRTTRPSGWRTPDGLIGHNPAPWPSPVLLPPVIVYRVLDHEQLEEQDFRSDQERGAPAAPWETPRHREGMSVWDTQRRARDPAKWLKRKRMGGRRRLYGGATAVAPPLVVERSGPSPGHHTLWGPPAAIFTRARVVEAV